ncbi:hypothetical protein Trydic_g15138 [Trypoxylus dichotomus]
MTGEVLTEWVKNVLPLVERNCVIVMDNATYHSIKIDKIPTTAWKKDALINWIISKRITMDNTLLKIELLQFANNYLNNNPIPYVIDEMVADSSRTILRSPPCHCNLNPIDMVWAKVKEYVAANKKPFQFPTAKELLVEDFKLVTPAA